MTKKIIIITGIVIVLFMAGYLIFFFSSKSSQERSRTPQSGLLPLPSLDSYRTSGQFPKTPTIKIGTSQGIIEVKNFYDSVVDTEEGLLILADANDYEIAYDRSNTTFMIATRSDAPESRQAGETALLNVLGIGQNDACKLNVQVFLNPSAQSRENQNLSFCLNKL